MHDFTEQMRQGMRELRAARAAATGRNSLEVHLALSNLESLCELAPRPQADLVDLRPGPQRRRAQPVSLG